MARQSAQQSRGPWLCAGAVLTAMVIGMWADGVADVLAGLLLVVPSGMVFRHLLRRA